MKTIPVALPLLGQAEADAAARTVLSGWVTQGPRVAEFEADFARFTGAAHACAVANCTVALHYALLAVGVRPGDTVVTVSHSFIATANAVRACGAEPVFADIDPDTLNMDPDELARILAGDYAPGPDGLYYKDVARLAQGESPLAHFHGRAGRLGAVLAVHQVGVPADMGRLLPLCREAGVPVVEDAACAVGSEVRLGGVFEKIGRPHGDVACFSFHPRKVITTGDGGMITTNDPGYDRRFRLLRQHGMSLSDAARHKAEDIVFEDYLITGHNGRMTDIQAAVGIEQLKRLPDIVARRREIAAVYAAALADAPGLVLPAEPPNTRVNQQSFVVRLDDPARQTPVMRALKEQGIATRRGIMCAHLEPPYAAAWQGHGLEKSRLARDTGVILPLYPSMDPDDAARVADALRRALGAA